MKMDHAALYVNDLERARSFFVKYFDVTVNEKYHNVKTGFESYFITFDGGGRLEIMTKPGIKQREKNAADCGFVHIAVSVGGKEKVDLLTKRLSDDGYTVLSAPRTTGDGYYESCVLDSEYNQIEIVG